MSNKPPVKSVDDLEKKYKALKLKTAQTDLERRELEEAMPKLLIDESEIARVVFDETADKGAIYVSTREFLNADKAHALAQWIESMITAPSNKF